MIAGNLPQGGSTEECCEESSVNFCYIVTNLASQKHTYYRNSNVDKMRCMHTSMSVMFNANEGAWYRTVNEAI